jgi:hypothetical protein
MQQITVFIDLQDQLNMFRTNICSCRVRQRGTTLPHSDRQPTTTTEHHTTCYNLQFYAPDDGHSFVRNMLN